MSSANLPINQIKPVTITGGKNIIPNAVIITTNIVNIYTKNQNVLTNKLINLPTDNPFKKKF